MILSGIYVVEVLVPYTRDYSINSLSGVDTVLEYEMYRIYFVTLPEYSTR